MDWWGDSLSLPHEIWYFCGLDFTLCILLLLRNIVIIILHFHGSPDYSLTNLIYVVSG